MSGVPDGNWLCCTNAYLKCKKFAYPNTRVETARSVLTQWGLRLGCWVWFITTEESRIVTKRRTGSEVSQELT